MTKILCNYNDATVKCLDMFTSGMVGAEISFEFSEEWEGLTKTAVFSAGDVQRDVLIGASNVITIPWEVLQRAKEQLIVGVYGTNGTELVIPTVYAGLGRIKTGADPSGDPGIPPTPSILDQVLTAASESLANAQRSEEKAGEAEASAEAAAESEANVQAMFDRMGDIPVVSATEFDADAETVIHRSSLVNLKTGATDTEESPLPVANTQQAGIMTAETVQAIMDLTAAVSTLTGQNIRLSYTAGATPTAAEIQSFVISKGYTDQTRWEYIAVVVKADNHVWRYYTGTGWQDDGIDTVSVATEYIMGVVLGSSTDGKVYVEADGTMSVNGYDAIISTLENLSTGKADDNAVYHEWRLGYNATAQTITKDGAAVPFADVYSAVEDKTKFVYVEWANRVYIPQYVSSGLIYFMCAYIDSGLIKLERIMFDAATGKALTGSLSTYDKTKIDELLRAKANASEVYTKTEIDAKETELKETLNTVEAVDKAQNRRLDNLEAAAEGNLYRVEVDTEEAYSKSVPVGALPWATLDSFGGKTQKWNQLVQNSDFSTTDSWTVVSGAALSVSNGIASWRTIYTTTYGESLRQGFVATAGHIYLFEGDMRVTPTNDVPNVAVGLDFWDGSAYGGHISVTIRTNSFEHVRGIVTAIASNRFGFSISRSGTAEIGIDSLVEVKNPRLIDLTAMFGAGNEPTTTDDPRIAWIEQYAAEHPEYDAGSLVSADVSSVDVKNANLLWFTQDTPNGGFEDGVYTSTTILGVSAWVARIDLSSFAGVSVNCESIVGEFKARLSNDYVEGSANIVNITSTGESITTKHKYFEKGSFKYLYLSYRTHASGARESLVRPCCYPGDTTREYAPYSPVTYPIPAAVRALPGYGETGAVVDFERKTYTAPDGTVTDITDLLADFDNNIKVEGGGSITFNNANKLPVPNEETYLIDIQEAIENG